MLMHVCDVHDVSNACMMSLVKNDAQNGLLMGHACPIIFDVLQVLRFQLCSSCFTDAKYALEVHVVIFDDGAKPFLLLQTLKCTF